MKLGFSGMITRRFIGSPLTPLLLIASLAFGLMAAIIIPREEEPQIKVPMVDVSVAAPGLRAPDAAELVTKPLETIVKSLDDVEHVYSQTGDDQVLVTARFKVGTDSDDAILRVHERLRANYDRIPVGIPEPVVVGRSINDVAILVVTLSPKPGADARWGPAELRKAAERLQTELMKVDDVGLTYIVGGAAEQIRIEPDPERLSAYGLTLKELAGKLAGANTALPAGRSTQGDVSEPVIAGQTLRGPDDIGLLELTTRDGRAVYLKDVADVVAGVSEPDARVWTLHPTPNGFSRAPAVTLAIAKRSGANAVAVSEAVLERLEALEGDLLPASLNVEVTRDYGHSAAEKADELMFHLGLATVSIVILIAFMIGWREGIVIAAVIPTTILLTLFAALLMGFTINRVMLFALIFSIGILVDDAVVVIENIARHWAMPDERDRVTAAVEAVAEVGNPTVVATLTVVTALLPMLFVSGLMGPYMAPIPINASAAMVFSFFVAVAIAPWLMIRIAGKAKHHAAEGESRLGRIYRRFAGPVVASKRASWIFLIGVGLATLAACTLFATKTVKVKLLPFDNKSELAIVVDLPEGTSLERTERVLMQAAAAIAPAPEIVSVQLHAGTAAPFNFNGLVRHYFYRSTPELGDLLVNLKPKSDRKRSSHEIAVDLRKRLAVVPLPPGSALKVVEVPPGPPVLATLLAEVYGPDAETRRAVTRELETLFRKVPYIVDVDTSLTAPHSRLRVTIDQDAVEHQRAQQGDVFGAIDQLMNGVRVGYSHRGEGRPPVEIVMALPKSARTWGDRLEATPIPLDTQPGDRRVTELGDVLTTTREPASPSIYRRDGRYAEMVTADLAGAYEAPIYGMLAVQKLVDEHDWKTLPKPKILLHGQPADERTTSLLWDGEWEVTYVTFRDMGAAFAVAILGIYILVVAQFGSFRLPLVILTPVPLTLIGIVAGHVLLGAPFTATSMIGFIALAGIVVRNSILLADFIRHGAAEGQSLEETLLEAGSVRFKPILLTALAAMIGAAVILFDPIFQGLAISLLFGLLSSTLLTVLVIPAIYIVFRSPPAAPPEGARP